MKAALRRSPVPRPRPACTQPARAPVGEPEYVPVPGTQLLWVAATRTTTYSDSGKTEHLLPRVRRLVLVAVVQRTVVTPRRCTPISSASSSSIRARASSRRSRAPDKRPKRCCSHRFRRPRASQAPKVIFQGNPGPWNPVEGTCGPRVVNTDKDIIKRIGNLCYSASRACGSWAAPRRPWQVAASLRRKFLRDPRRRAPRHLRHRRRQRRLGDVRGGRRRRGMMSAGWGCAVWAP